jgi:ferritin-like metal-binding protein YciE
VSTRTTSDQLVKYLTDAHSIEEQALAQLRTAPDIAGNGRLAEILADHLPETERHERKVRDRLEALGGSPSTVKDVVMAAGGKGFILFARSQPDTPGKLLAHAYSYEHLELAAYRLLAIAADRAGDTETTALANDIAEEERLMGERLASCYDDVAAESLAAIRTDDPESALTSYLADAHALEQQAIALLGRATSIAGDPMFVEVYELHLEESREHAKLVERRLEAHEAGPSVLKDAAMRMGGLNWSAFFQAHPDTPGKLAAFAYAFEHLEIAGYELLARVAERAGDEHTRDACHEILRQERAAAGMIAATFERAADASLAATTTPRV